MNHSVETASHTALVLTWILLGGLFTANALRVYRARRADPKGEAGRTRDRRGTVGMLLEGVGLFFAWLPRNPARQPPDWLLLTGVIIAFVSLLLAWIALRHLGSQWRIQAVVTDVHELVTTGPYSVVRHPIYTSLMGMALATAIVVSTPSFTLLAMAIYIAGTEIRVRAEDRLLAARFGAAAREYQSRVAAYIPYLR
ncbi:MAG TPA: isoprenylcysteine carboxylmethyltransferase family protein [Bryobacteraceae bacterium]|nr:isoprenylcysteine carboxylmethyltransferase family protein [Bryobacteraceae bacterium]